MSKAFRRYDAIAALREPAALHQESASKPMNIPAIFGEYTFHLDNLKARLPKSAWKELRRALSENNPIDLRIADAVAVAMKDWALEHGVSHYTHWFQPLTGSTAEKHDSFITPNQGGGAMAEFSGKDLIQGEPDASSFPSGGLRATFEARGYTAWDPTSPAFISKSAGGSVLCIPTAFASWKGEALDHKIPLLRSIDALNKVAVRALHLLDEPEVSSVQSTVGFEQEYFLIDQEFFYRRPDLVTSGRSLFGAKPPRGQELEDHYFGSIPDRILAYMTEVERELYRLGVPVKTRHNEVAPGQYEIAPIYENANVAADHQQLTMLTLKRIARKYGLVCILHEKPFQGVNGSGKHTNWSLATDTGINLLEPGENPHESALFMFFCTAVIKAVHDHQDLLRIAIAHAGNDHRLGANEAPPSILSVFLGEQLQDIMDQVLAAGGAKSSKNGGFLGLGTTALPHIPKHAGDRNRTSPFAFTGNKFEFRAVGSSQSVSFPVVVLNTIIAEAIDHMSGLLEMELAKNADLTTAYSKVIHSVLKESHSILFNGDGYSIDWVKEAETRGLLNLRTTMDALPLLVADKNVKLFEKYGVLNHRELESRYEIMVDQYFKTINIEAETTASITDTMILPATVRYMNELLAYQDRGRKASLNTSGVDKTIVELNDLINELNDRLYDLKAVNADLGGDTVFEKAEHMRANVIPAMNSVRVVADKLERITADDYWPLPTYREMLFMK
jgi:glutamine synthetase